MRYRTGTMIEEVILPVYKKVNVNLTVNRRGVGANPNDVTMQLRARNAAANYNMRD